FPPATTPIVQLSTDTFTNVSSQHATEVEPGSFSFGNTIMVSFQVGRIAGGGAADIGPSRTMPAQPGKAGCCPD
ncbi:MAG: hypothetical protein DMG93_08700, partial [Acidobacteria bacterium]